MRPLVRLVAAILLPLMVPGIITGALWALPGDPASIICPPGACDGTEALAARWGLDKGPFNFYVNWMIAAAQLDFGRSWTVMAGSPVFEELIRSVPVTGALVGLALLPLVLGSVGSATGWLPEATDWAWKAIGLVPGVILALLAAAWVEIGYGFTLNPWPEVATFAVLQAGVLACAVAPWGLRSLAAWLGWVPGGPEAVRPAPWLLAGLALAAVAQVVVWTWTQPNLTAWEPTLMRLALGALVLGLSDGALADAVSGTRTVFHEEVKQRYVQIAMLRGESVLGNALPNVLPSLIGQFRGRVLHILSGAVVVEVVVGIPGLGDLLWEGTLGQDFGIVLAATFAFAAFSGALMLVQALVEILVALYVRRHPPGVLEAG